MTSFRKPMRSCSRKKKVSMKKTEALRGGEGKEEATDTKEGGGAGALVVLDFNTHQTSLS